MLFQVLAFLSLLAPAATGAADIHANSQMGRALLAKARTLEGNDINYDFVGDYSIKFQGCHHVSQWNANANDEDDVRIKTKRLVRFRLCPSNSCQNDRAAGCTTKFGDYVVDLNTFVAAYLDNAGDEMDDMCTETATECQSDCNGGNDADCITQCYDDFGMNMCLEDGNDQQNGFDVNDYAECGKYQFGKNRRNLADNAAYYMGPYCADQGGEIHLGLFTDDTCTSFLENGQALFYTNMGYELPYSDTSIISNRCLKCSRTQDDGNVEIKDVCKDVYLVSGKCETKMSIDYPNESACTYIEGIKIIRADGVIRTSAVKKSKAAAVCIGLFLTVAVLLAGYVYYLRTKLGRAKINLSAASQGVMA
jgi:hypothetical protein